MYWCFVVLLSPFSYCFSFAASFKVISIAFYIDWYNAYILHDTGRTWAGQKRWTSGFEIGHAQCVVWANRGNQLPFTSVSSIQLSYCYPFKIILPLSLKLSYFYPFNYLPIIHLKLPFYYPFKIILLISIQNYLTIIHSKLSYYYPFNYFTIIHSIILLLSIQLSYCYPFNYLTIIHSIILLLSIQNYLSIIHSITLYSLFAFHSLIYSIVFAPSIHSLL